MPSNETLVYRTKSNAIDYKFQFVTTPAYSGERDR
ncbi:hypothetical protein Cenrod_2667 [Candidatus Symbiobacter mobilis CR]|uniref:Uncharacterized protein n=1 Tax=Candidatus Symbiobacter mobilis CR TaxID=946483 RepID=U5NBB5_9BURK|nr:hypothetical protein Cenrod_2667 [Candidatus Symbiobacter mobilis CR]